jgi:hypothetical protein
VEILANRLTMVCMLGRSSDQAYMSNERVLDPGVWAGGTPTSGPIDQPENLGYWFELDEPGWLTGFSMYTDGRNPDFVLFQLWPDGGDLIAQQARTAPESARIVGAAGWRNVWLHPRCPLAATTPYLLSACCQGIFVDFGQLTSSPVTSGHITVYQSGSSPNPGNGIFDSVTDSSQYFNFLNPPHDDVAGHLYGIDLLIEFPL